MFVVHYCQEEKGKIVIKTPRIKNVLDYVLSFAMSALFFYCENPFFAIVIPLAFFAYLLIKNNATSFIFKGRKELKPICVVILVFALAFPTAINVKAKIIESNMVKKIEIISSTRVLDKLKENFSEYQVSNYDRNIELEDRPCLMELRLTYILSSLLLIDETNNNIKERNKNLKNRGRDLERNAQKINKRIFLAQKEPLTFDIPVIQEQKVCLEGFYKRVMLWGDEIKKNITTPTCSDVCAFNHIDQSSINIVNEVDLIKSKQDLANEYLTQTERTFDKLEAQQRKAEIELVALGF